VTRRNETTHPLTDLQQALLDYLWAKGPATAEQVREALAGEYPLKDSSVRTLLRRLEARGYVTHTTEGKTFVYAARRPSQEVAAGALRHIIRKFFAGSVEQLLVGMVDEKVVSADELARLTRKLRTRR
jgi:BlaI family penicillinase repressor